MDVRMTKIEMKKQNNNSDSNSSNKNKVLLTPSGDHNEEYEITRLNFNEIRMKIYVLYL